MVRTRTWSLAARVRTSTPFPTHSVTSRESSAFRASVSSIHHVQE